MSEPAPGAVRRAAAGPAFRLEARADAGLAACGALTFATARQGRLHGLAVLKAAPAQPALVIDCAGITACDSAGLAVLLDWLAAARAVPRTLRYTALPPGVAALAHISAVEQLLERGV